MKTMKEVIDSTTWVDIEKVIDVQKDYVFSKYKHRLHSIYTELKQLQFPIFNTHDMHLHFKKIDSMYQYYISFGESFVEVDYMIWELVLSTPIDKETLDTHSVEEIVTYLLKVLFHYGKTKSQSDVNINWMMKEHWIVSTTCSHVPFIMLKQSDFRTHHMKKLGANEKNIISIFDPTKNKYIYEKDEDYIAV